MQGCSAYQSSAYFIPFLTELTVNVTTFPGPTLAVRQGLTLGEGPEEMRPRHSKWRIYTIVGTLLGHLPAV